MIYRIVLAILLWLPTSLIGQKTADENYLRAKALFESEKFDSAMIFFTLSKGTEEKNVQTWLYTGKIHYMEGRYSQAKEDFMTAEKLKPGIAGLMLAKVYACEDHLDKCLFFLEKHIKSTYKEPESTLLLDKDLSRFENTKEWVEFWKQNSRYYSGYDTFMAETDYLVKTGDYIEAINHIGIGLKKGYRSSALLAKRANIYFLMENYSLSLQDLNKAIGKKTRVAGLYIKRAEVNMKLKNYKSALNDFTQAIRLEPDNFDLYPQRALANSHINQREEALKDISYYLSYFPENDEAWYIRGLIHSESGNYLEALRNYNRALQLNGKEARYYLARGESYYNTRTYQFAGNDLSMALDLDPTNPDVYLLKGLTALKTGDTQMACFCFREAYKYGSREAWNYLIETGCEQ